MTILQTYRWKCDYCGAVSPEMGGPGDIPMGWASFIVPLAHPANGTVRHFCTTAHANLWVYQDRTVPEAERMLNRIHKLTRLME